MAKGQDGKPVRTGVRRAELDPERPRPFDTPWGSFALYVVSGRLVAAESFCPHILGPLFQGTRSGEDAAEVTCPWHGWRYSLRSGACVASPEDEGRDSAIRFLEVRLDGEGQVLLVGPPLEAPPEGPEL